MKRNLGVCETMFITVDHDVELFITVHHEVEMFITIDAILLSMRHLFIKPAFELKVVEISVHHIVFTALTCQMTWVLI